MSLNGSAQMPVIERVKLDLSAELMEHYEAMSMLAGCGSVEEYLVQHLEFSRSWTADGLHLTDAESTALRRMLGSQVGGKKSLVECIKRLVSMKVSGWRIELPESVQEQLHWYAKSSGKRPEEIVPQLILDAIREKFQA